MQLFVATLAGLAGIWVVRARAAAPFSDLPELQSVAEGRIARTLGSEIARKLQGIAAGKAVVVRTGPTRFAVLLRNFDSGRSRQAIAAAFGKGCCLAFEMGNGEISFLRSGRARRVTHDACAPRMIPNGLILNHQVARSTACSPTAVDACPT